MSLTSTAVKNAKPKKSKQYRMTDGDGMYLLIKPTGKKYWRLDYRLHGKRKTYAIGRYPAISLKDARSKRDDAKALVADGIDPVQYRQRTQHKQVAAAANTFMVVSAEWFGKQEQIWSKGHARTVTGRLDRNLLPWLGERPIDEISPQELLRVLRRIEARGAIETAHRCKTICSQVFRYAIACGLADRDPAADLKGALTPVQAKKMSAITEPEKVGALMKSIAGYQGDIVTRVALRFSALTFCRPGEIRKAEWSEVCWIKKIWSIPAKKMKGKRDHTVPLSEQALEALRELYPLTKNSNYVFPSLRSASRPMSENTVLGALRRMGYTKEEMVPHGFRSTASTLLHENGWDHDLIELQLAHTIGSKVSAAYNRSLRLPERSEMMMWWAAYLDRLEYGEDHGDASEIIG